MPAGQNSAYPLISTGAARFQIAKESPMLGVEEHVAGSLTLASRELSTASAAKLDCATSLDALILECIDETLADLLGRRAKEAVYDHLERNLFLARNEIPQRLDDFLSVLDETFGKGGKTIGKYIAKKLYAKLEWEFADIVSYGLVDYVGIVRARVEREVRKASTHL